MRIRDHIAAMLPERLEVRAEDFLNNFIRRALCTRVLTMPYRLCSDVAPLLREYKTQLLRNQKLMDDNVAFAGEYLNVLVETNNTDMALRLVATMSDASRINCSRQYFRVAQLSRQSKVATREEIRMAETFDALLKNHASETLLRIVEGKSIAVVGNGPSEVGKGSGSEIDSHDVVFRINNYAIDGYENDYGTKTDIWVKASLDFMRHGIRDERIKAVLYESNLERFSLYDGYVNAMNDEMRSCFVDYCDQDDHAFFCEKHYRYPTTGLMIINKLRRLPIKSLDAYGFSYLQEQIKRTGSFDHYSKSDAIKTRELNRRWHHMDCELEYFRRWFPNKSHRMLMP